MPQAIAAFVGQTIFRLGASAVVAEIGATVAYVATIATITVGARKVLGLETKYPTDDRGRSITARSTIEPAKAVYGQALVSGPVVWIGTHIPDNQWLDTAIALTWHECEAITDVHLDAEVITDAQIGGSGNVTSGKFGPRPTTIAFIARYLGTATQAADSTLTGHYPLWTAAHQGKEVAYLRTTFWLGDNTETLWNQYSPTNTRALVKGLKVYDPRLDTSPGANPTNPAYIAWSDNPALCVADYATNAAFWEAIPHALINYQSVADAADDCDVLVAIPTAATQKRFTCNGALFLTEEPRANLERLLSSMNGTIQFIGDAWHIDAGVFKAPTLTLDESWVAGPIEIQTGLQGGDRFNTVDGVFIDPENTYKPMEFPRVGGVGSAWYARDHSYELPREISLPFTNNQYTAQRLAYKQLYQTDYPIRMTVPANVKGLQLAAGDRVTVDLAEPGWTGGATKVFKVMAIAYQNAADIAVTLTLREDHANAWTDPIESEYSTMNSAGVLTFVTGRRLAGVDDGRFDDFTTYLTAAEFAQRWEIFSGSQSLLSFVNDTAGAMGDQVLEVGDNAGNDELGVYLNLEERIPLELNVLYRAAFYVKEVAASATASLFLGVAGVAGDGVTLVNVVGANSAGSQHYVAANSVEPADNNWNNYVGYFKRTGGAYAAYSATIVDPTIIHPNAHFAVPIMYIHNSAEAGQSRVAYVSITRVENLTTLNNDLPAANLMPEKWGDFEGFNPYFGDNGTIFSPAAAWTIGDGVSTAFMGKRYLFFSDATGGNHFAPLTGSFTDYNVAHRKNRRFLVVVHAYAWNDITIGTDLDISVDLVFPTGRASSQIIGGEEFSDKFLYHQLRFEIDATAFNDQQSYVEIHCDTLSTIPNIVISFDAVMVLDVTGHSQFVGGIEVAA